LSPDGESRTRGARATALALPLRDSWRPWSLPDLNAFAASQLLREVEERRLFPWLPVFFGLGILLFFQAEGRPALWAPVLGSALSLAGAVAGRRNLRMSAALLALAFVFAGFAAAVIRTRGIEAPVLARTIVSPVSGFIEAVEERPEGVRLVLQVTGLDRVPAAERPRRLRVSVRDGRGLAPGQHVAGTARLLPPPEPAWPGGYDFARDAYFRGLGAVGSLTGPIRQTAPPHAPGWRLAMAASLDEARNALTRRIADAIGGPAGAVAAALVTGKRGLIDEPTNDVLRAAGIYHIVST
jgi:competence protein ComEC